MSDFGFFSSEDLSMPDRYNGAPASCVSCGLYKKVLSPKMEPFGNFKKGILNIGEAPGEQEDRKGKQWQGKMGGRLRRTYKKLGIDLFEDCMNINAINCRPTDDNGNNRAPDNKEMQCCYKRVFKVIKEHKPKVIILIGGSALQSIIGTRVTKNLGALSKWRGFAIPDKHYKAWLCPVFHPSYVERADLPEIYNIWERDIENAFRCTLEGRPTNPAYKEYLDKVELLNEKEAGQVLKDISWREAAFDYEATGLKPHRKGHDIISVSISNGDRVFAFLLYDEIRDLFRKFLTNPKIGKIAHNMQFEHTWSEVILGVDVYPWVKDTMINAHVIDNRPGIKGLKHQVYLNFGIPDYSSEVDKYLKAKDSNSFNRIRELIQTDLGVKQLLQYNGLDSFFGFEYYNIQKSLI